MYISDVSNKMVAAESCSAGFCNMNCLYCFIPKSKAMFDLHKEIMESIDNGEFLKNVKEIYGERLEHFAFWGTEPTLLMHKFTEHMEEFFVEFPKLANFGFSSNMLENQDRIVNLVKKIQECSVKFNRRIKSFDVQVSLDGPEWITDNNRKEGATRKIIDGYCYLLKEFDKLDLSGYDKFVVHFKPTVSVENMVELNKDDKKLLEWFKLFDELLAFYDMEVKNKDKIQVLRGCVPTLVVPGCYTTEDGKIVAEYFKNIRELMVENRKNRMFKHISPMLNGYIGRLDRVVRFSHDLNHNPSMFTCSAGDTCFGVEHNGKLHICHGSFFYSDPRYVQSCLENKDEKVQWLVDHGRIDAINKLDVVTNEDEENYTRLLYTQRNFHDFFTMKNSYNIAMMKQMAIAGQINKEYGTNKELAVLGSMFLNTGMSCHMENMLNTGSMYLHILSLFRVLFNGAFEEILKTYNLYYGRKEE